MVLDRSVVERRLRELDRRAADTYEGSLRELASRSVVKDETYEGFRGLGGFRNVLAHEYLEIDVERVVDWRTRVLEGVPSFIAEVERWVDTLEETEEAP